MAAIQQFNNDTAGNGTPPPHNSVESLLIASARVWASQHESLYTTAIEQVEQRMADQFLYLYGHTFPSYNALLKAHTPSPTCWNTDLSNPLLTFTNQKLTVQRVGNVSSYPAAFADIPARCDRAQMRVRIDHCPRGPNWLTSKWRSCLCQPEQQLYYQMNRSTIIWQLEKSKVCITSDIFCRIVIIIDIVIIIITHQSLSLLLPLFDCSWSGPAWTDDVSELGRLRSDAQYLGNTRRPEYQHRHGQVLQCSLVQCSVVQCSVVQCSVVQCGIVQCSVDVIKCNVIFLTMIHVHSLIILMRTDRYTPVILIMSVMSIYDLLGCRRMAKISPCVGSFCKEM